MVLGAENQENRRTENLILSALTTLLEKNNALDTKTAAQHAEVLRKVCDVTTGEYDLSLQLLGLCVTCSLYKLQQSLHFQKPYSALTMLQIDATKQQEHDLLDRSARQSGYHPLLKALFRLTPYPSDGHIRDTAFSYAGVNGLNAFKLAFCADSKGGRTATPPLLRALLTKVCIDCAGSNCCTYNDFAPSCPAQSAALVMIFCAIAKQTWRNAPSARAQCLDNR